jgi:hypothetical protein
VLVLLLGVVQREIVFLLAIYQARERGWDPHCADGLECGFRVVLWGAGFVAEEDVYERNVARQKDVMKTADDSAKLHAKLRQERPAIEGAPQWGSVD